MIQLIQAPCTRIQESAGDMSLQLSLSVLWDRKSNQHVANAKTRYLLCGCLPCSLLHRGMSKLGTLTVKMLPERFVIIVRMSR